MHNNLIKDLPDLEVKELVQTEKYLTFIVDYKIDYVKFPICGKKADNIHDRRPQSIQDFSFRYKKVVIKIVKNAIVASIVSKEQYQKN